MALCPHGFAPDACLICATLASSPAKGSGNGPAVAVDDRDRGERSRRRPWAHHDGGHELEAVTIVERGEPPSRRPHRPLATALLVIVALIAAVAAVWVVVGVVFALLRIIEVVAAAVAAGWIGYRAGHWRGRHGH